jgi:mono/diheme cytochrome c family protein
MFKKASAPAHLALAVVMISAALAGCTSEPAATMAPTQPPAPNATQSPALVPTQPPAAAVTAAPAEDPSGSATTEPQPTATTSDTAESAPTPLAEPTEAAAEATAPGGKVLVAERCVQCHGLDRVERARKTGDQWRNTVERMISKGTQLSPQELDAVVQYLTETFPR